MRKSVISIMVLTVFGIAMLALYGTSFAGKTRVAVLTGVRGTVTVKESGETAAKAASEKMPVNEGDVIRTGGSGSSVIIRFDDGSMVKVGPLASMTIGKMAGAGNTNNTELNMDMGKTWARVKKLSGDSSFRVKTPTAVAGVRGTYYSSEVDNDSTSQFDVFEGEIAVSGATTPGQEVVLKENQTTTVAEGKTPSKPAAIPQDRLQENKGVFSEEEFTQASYDMQVNVTPQVLAPGEKAKLSIQVFKNGAPFKSQVNMHLKLSGSAKFATNNASEMDATTDAGGALSMDITDSVEESVSVDVRLKMKVSKSK